ncbi:P2X purinoceptor 4-like [Aptenodytes patagonicus]|uniref:P2X purinoceptor 4-like n=1 Tax=Aptenodytes patagonicus TaxID=9234 RepID=UPI003FA119CC
MASLPMLPRASANAPERLETGPSEGASAHAQSGGGAERGGGGRGLWRGAAASAGRDGTRRDGTGSPLPAEGGCPPSPRLFRCPRSRLRPEGRQRGAGRTGRSPGGVAACPGQPFPLRRFANPAGLWETQISPLPAPNWAGIGIFYPQLLTRGQLVAVPQQQAVPRTVAKSPVWLLHSTSALDARNGRNSCILIAYRLYEETDEVNSSVCTTVKGVAYTNDRIRDTAEYTIPMQVLNSFFVMANIIKTENQLEQWCPEYPFAKAICSSDKSCEKGSVDIHSHGIETGRCVNYNATVKTCKVKAWCPVESMENLPEPAVLRSSEDFTVLIKNNIHFPKFNYTIHNIPPNLDTFCTYNKITSPLCPIFHLGDILQEAKENFSEVAVKGGIVATEINWECNLDSWFYDCSPKYGFCCLDDKTIKPGFYFRYARYYKLPHGKEQRTLFKVYGIRFDVLVFGTGNGRKFNSIELIKNIGSMISYFGLVVSAIEIAIGVGNCSSCGKSPFYKIYNKKKYEPVLNPRQSHPVKFGDAGSCCTSESNENRDNEECELMRTSESNENDDNEEYELG